MDIIEAIFSRRSIRKYTSAEVPQEILDKILKAGMSAPSAHNLQPWHFLIIKSRKKLEQIRTFHPHAEMLREAALAIIICGDLTLDDQIGYLVQACAAATENILLAAHGLGWGAVWLGLYPRSERQNRIIRLFQLPENIIPLTMVALGAPNEIKHKIERFKPDRIHLNQW